MKKLHYALLSLLMAAVCILPAAAVGTEAASPVEISAENPAQENIMEVELSSVSAGQTLCLDEPGTYRLTGMLSGQILADTDGDMTLILAGASVTGEECIVLKGDGSVTIRTESGTVNTLSDGASGADDRASAAVVSKCPLTVDGDGVLIVSAGANNGIEAKKGLTVSGGTVQVTAANNGIKTDGGLAVTGGDISVVSGGNGLVADTSRLSSGDISVSGGSVVIMAQEKGLSAENNIAVSGGAVNITAAEDAVRGTDVAFSGGTLIADAADEGIQADSTLVISGGTAVITAAGNGLSCEGSIVIEDGTLTLSSQGDAIQGVSGITVSGGNLDITTGEGAGNAINRSDSGGMGFGGPGGFGGGNSGKYTMPSESLKGLKSGGDIAIEGGVIVLNCVDDAVHAGGDVTVGEPDMTISSNDDAIHADGDITIDGGCILVLDCFEGIEGCNITVNGGDTDVYSVNDGINATSGSDGFGGWGGSDCSFTMNGGELDIYVTGTSSNLGDGVDSNGSLTINGGRITSSTVGGTMENGLDSGGSFVVNGGIVASGGNSGMQESAASSSLQCTAVLTLSGYVSAGTDCVVTDADGNELIRWAPYNGCNCLIFSHPDFVIGGTYTLTYGTTTMEFTFDSVSYSSRSGFGGFGGFPF